MENILSLPSSMKTFIRRVPLAGIILIVQVCAGSAPRSYDVTGKTAWPRNSPLGRIIFNNVYLDLLDEIDQHERYHTASPSGYPRSSHDLEDRPMRHQETPHVPAVSEAETKRGPLFGCDYNRYAHRRPTPMLADVRKRHPYHPSREELFKRSPLNDLIRRLMAMNGQSFNRGRAATIRFGVGGK